MEYLRERIKEIARRGPFVIKGVVFDPYEVILKTSGGSFVIKDKLPISAQSRDMSCGFDISKVSENEKRAIRALILGSEFHTAAKNEKITLRSSAWTICLDLNPNGLETLNFHSIDGDFVAI